MDHKHCCIFILLMSLSNKPTNKMSPRIQLQVCSILLEPSNFTQGCDLLWRCWLNISMTTSVSATKKVTTASWKWKIESEVVLQPWKGPEEETDASEWRLRGNGGGERWRWSSEEEVWLASAEQESPLDDEILGMCNIIIYNLPQTMKIYINELNSTFG